MKHGLLWYWHRLRAMDRAEWRERLAQKWRKRVDARRPPDFRGVPGAPARPGAWPLLPARESLPPEVEPALRREVEDVLRGYWRAFGHLPMRVDDPPNWFKDHAARRDLTSVRSGFRLNHRELPPGSDIKLVWELSRWSTLVRLAQGAWALDHEAAGRKCLAWLDHWRKQNPPYIGWNWTSALEAGMRLLNFCWIDALLSAAGTEPDRLAALRARLVPAHLWYVSRHRSFGSSANNHLLGELAGLVTALARWPDLAAWCAPLESLHAEWEREVLAQFAPDGGNREQALNYQLYSWELCWHTRNALRAAGRPVSDAVEDRLRRAADFFVAVQSPKDAWDYGDSDSATAVPLFSDDAAAIREWFQWFSESSSSPALRWWLGEPPQPCQPPACQQGPADWVVFPDSGQASWWAGRWQTRWDLSPLGYLSTAAHGHLDALHLSLWLDEHALVIDPGTGAYYGDTRLRAWLASWAAHNGPHRPGVNFPERLGPFLWGPHHARPTWRTVGELALEAELVLPHGTARRRVTRLLAAETDGWLVEDGFAAPSPVPDPTPGAGTKASPAPGRAESGFRVCWHFAPGTRLEPDTKNPRLCHGYRRGVRFTVEFDAAWTKVEYVAESRGGATIPVAGDLVGLCSPAFRDLEAGPMAILAGRLADGVPHRTVFLAVRDEWT